MLRARVKDKGLAPVWRVARHGR